MCEFGASVKHNVINEPTTAIRVSFLMGHRAASNEIDGTWSL
jgi:hypothetical protein